MRRAPTLFSFLYTHEEPHGHLEYRTGTREAYIDLATLVCTYERRLRKRTRFEGKQSWAEQLRRSVPADGIQTAEFDTRCRTSGPFRLDKVLCALSNCAFRVLCLRGLLLSVTGGAFAESVVFVSVAWHVLCESLHGHAARLAKICTSRATRAEM